MALISKVSYKVSGDYYKPKTKPPQYNEPSQRQRVTVAPKPVINNQYTSGQTAIPGMAGWKVPAAVATPPVYIPPPAPPVAPVPIVNPYTTGQAPIPGMAGYKVPAQEKGVGYKPNKVQLLGAIMDKYFGSISYPDYAATAYKSAPQTTIPKPVRPGSEPIPYKYPIYPSQTTIPQPAHPGWNPQPYKYPVYPSQTTIPQPARPGSNAPIASPWVSAAQNNLMVQEDRYAGLGRNSPVVSEPIVKFMGLGNQPYNGYNQFDPIARRDFVAPNGSRTQPGTPQAGSMGGMIEDRFTRGNFLREMTYNQRPTPNTPQGYFDTFVLNGRTYSVPNRMLSFAKDYPWETSTNWYAPPNDWVDTTQQWKESFDQGWQVNPMVDNTAYEPYVEGGAGGWGYGGGYGGGGGYGSSHYNSNPNYIGSNRGYAQSHRQNMLLWNI